MDQINLAAPVQAADPPLDVEQYLHLYEQMSKIREFEEQVNALYQGAKMPGLAHLYTGEEAIAVGVCEALRRDDYITSTPSRARALSRERRVGRPDVCRAVGQGGGYCRGKGGSMHIADQDTATSAPMQSWGQRRHCHGRRFFRHSAAARTRSPSVSLATARWGKGCCTK